MKVLFPPTGAALICSQTEGLSLRASEQEKTERSVVFSSERSEAVLRSVKTVGLRLVGLLTSTKLSNHQNARSLSLPRVFRNDSSLIFISKIVQINAATGGSLFPPQPPQRGEGFFSPPLWAALICSKNERLSLRASEQEKTERSVVFSSERSEAVLRSVKTVGLRLVGLLTSTKLSNHQNARSLSLPRVFRNDSSLIFISKIVQINAALWGGWGCIFLLLLFLPFTHHAQTYVQFQTQIGYIVKNHPKFTPVYAPSFGAVVGVVKMTNQPKEWHYLFHFPEIGVNVGFFTFGNPKVLGNAYTLSPHFSQNLWCKKKVDIQYRLGTTLAYASKPYHFVNNPTNTVIGSKINNYSFAELRFLWHISPQSNLLTAFHVGHFSNGNTSIPNLGINIPAFAVGYEYQWKAAAVSKYDVAIQQELATNRRNKQLNAQVMAGMDSVKAKKWASFFVSARLGMGMTEKGNGASPKYPIYVGSLSLNRDYKKWLRLKAGIETFYTTAAKEVIVNQDYPLNPQTAPLGLVVYVGSSFLMGHTALVLQAGPYLKKPYQFDYTLYTKLGLEFYPYLQQKKYRFQPFLGIYVHSHSGEADFAEASVGYSF